MANHTDIHPTHVTHATERSLWGPGVRAGVVAAVVMALFAMVVAALHGPGFFAPMKLVSGVVFGQQALTMGAPAVAIGIVIHLAVGSVFGVLFANTVPHASSFLSRAGIGLIYGAAVFLVMTFLVLPWADSVMAEHISRGWFFFYHMVFGFILGWIVR